MGRNSSNGARSRRNARRRGYAFENRTAADLPGGHIFTGTAGDVNYDGLDGPGRAECKYRAGLQSYGELRSHIEQAKRNVSGDPSLEWSLHITGGKSFMNSESYTLIPTARFRELLERCRKQATNQELRDLVREVVREAFDEREALHDDAL